MKFMNESFKHKPLLPFRSIIVQLFPTRTWVLCFSNDKDDKFMAYVGGFLITLFLPIWASQYYVESFQTVQTVISEKLWKNLYYG